MFTTRIIELGEIGEARGTVSILVERYVAVVVHREVAGNFIRLGQGPFRDKLQNNPILTNIFRCYYSM